MVQNQNSFLVKQYRNSVCVCVCVSVCACVRVCMCTCVWRLIVNFKSCRDGATNLPTNLVRKCLFCAFDEISQVNLFISTALHALCLCSVLHRLLL